MAFTYNPYKESDSVAKKRKELEENEALAPTWKGSAYDTAINDLVSRIQNREPFSYDVNAEALYQQYKDQYMNAGRLAMQDTMGKAAALTGGYGNSYADMVGNQAYQAYLEKMNAVVPELYGMAYDQYKAEGDDLKDQYSLLANQRNNEYNIYQDALSRWQNENTRLTNAYNTERNFDYNRYADDYDRAYKAYAMNNPKTTDTPAPTASDAAPTAPALSLEQIRDELSTMSGNEQRVFDRLNELLEAGVITQKLFDELFDEYGVAMNADVAPERAGVKPIKPYEKAKEIVDTSGQRVPSTEVREREREEALKRYYSIVHGGGGRNF